MTITTGKEALMQILHQEGIEYVFGIPGATEVQFMDALEDHPELKYILCLNELTAVGMAEGYTRAGGKIACLNLHTGTGLAASLALLSNVFSGYVPMIVTAGQQDTRLLATEPAMSADLVKIATPFVKWGAELVRSADLPLIMRRAFKVARHPPQGPVLVSLPLDVLADSFDFEYIPGNSSFTRLHPDERAVEIATKLLSRARNPAIIVEDGVTRCGAQAEAIKLAEMSGARVYQPWMSDMNFPVHHPQYLGDIDVTTLITRSMLEKVDVLVSVGAQLFQQPVYFPESLIPSTTQIIQIDDNPWQIAKNFPVACSLEGDIKSALTDLIAALSARLSPGARSAAIARIKTISGEKGVIDRTFDERALKERDKVPVAGTRLMLELRDALKPGTHVVDDCWSYSSILRRTLPLDQPDCYQRSRSGGSIGGGLPAALGAKLALPESPVVCVSGDGSAMWGIQSLWVGARYRIPVTFIILSNGAYRQVRIMKTKIMGEASKGRDLGTELYPPRIDFCRIAEGMGLLARKVEKPEQLQGALRQALDCSQPNLVEVIVDPSF